MYYAGLCFNWMQSIWRPDTRMCRVFSSIYIYVVASCDVL